MLISVKTNDAALKSVDQQLDQDTADDRAGEEAVVVGLGAGVGFEPVRERDSRWGVVEPGGKRGDEGVEIRLLAG